MVGEKWVKVRDRMGRGGICESVVEGRRGGVSGREMGGCVVKWLVGDVSNHCNERTEFGGVANADPLPC